MKIYCLSSLIAATALSTSAAFAAPATPKYLDFDHLPAAHGGDLVEIDLDEGLLSLASHFVGAAEKETADVLRGLKHVNVHVISLDDANRGEVVQRIQAARDGLTKDGWRRLVTVRQGGDQDVMVFAQTEMDAINGVAVTIVDGRNQAVVVNVTGSIKPEQIAALGKRFDIEPLKNLSVASK